MTVINTELLLLLLLLDVSFLFSTHLHIVECSCDPRLNIYQFSISPQPYNNSYRFTPFAFEVEYARLYFANMIVASAVGFEVVYIHIVCVCVVCSVADERNRWLLWRL